MARADHLQEVWQLDLRKVLKQVGAVQSPDLPVFLLRFSPNGRQIAGVVDEHGSEGAPTGHLLVIQVGDPKVDMKVFDARYPSLYRADSDFGWSPSGTKLFDMGNVIHISDGKNCITGEREGRTAAFITDDSLISAFAGWEGQPPTPLTSFTMFDAGCAPAKKWKVGYTRYLWDASATTGRLLLAEGNVDFLFHLVDAQTLQEIFSRSGQSAVLAEDGKSFCLLENRTDKWLGEIHCWEADTGKELRGRSPQNARPIRGATGASRILIEQYRRIPWFIAFQEGDVYQPSQNVVWDFRRGSEIVSWNVKSQSHSPPWQSRGKRKMPFSLDISPDGNYIVEGGSGVIRLYKIVP